MSKQSQTINYVSSLKTNNNDKELKKIVSKEKKKIKPISTHQFKKTITKSHLVRWLMTEIDDNLTNLSVLSYIFENYILDFAIEHGYKYKFLDTFMFENFCVWAFKNSTF